MKPRRTLSLPGAVAAVSAFAVLALAPPFAAADTINWTGNGSNANWSTPENWDGNVLPDAGGIGVIPSGMNATADGNLVGDPAIVVAAGGALSVADGGGTDISGMTSITINGTLSGRRADKVGSGIVFNDDSHFEMRNSGGFGDNAEIVTINGDVTFSRTQTSTTSTTNGRFRPEFSGNGTLHLNGGDANNPLSIGPSGDQSFTDDTSLLYHGNVVIEAGDVSIDRNVRGGGILTSGDVTVDSDATLNIGIRLTSADVQPFANTTILTILGTGGTGGTVNWTGGNSSWVDTQSKQDGSQISDTLEALVIDGAAIAAGDYTLYQLNALAGRTVFTENYDTRDLDETNDVVLRVLNTATVPEPASLVLLALGGALMLPRRRRAVRGWHG